MNRRRPNNHAAPQHFPPAALEYDPSFRRYRHRAVIIKDLPPDWEATVCPISGMVLFEHLPTGTKQNQVPPGFADASPAGTSTSTCRTTSPVIVDGVEVPADESEKEDVKESAMEEDS